MGKTGVETPFRIEGTGKGPDVDRLLRFGFSRGTSLRHFRYHHSEARIKKVVSQDPGGPQADLSRHQRSPKTPDNSWGCSTGDWRGLGTDYVDLLFIHSFGDYHSLDDAIAMVKSKELEEVSEAAKRSGKARLSASRPMTRTAPVDLGGG